MQLRSTFDRIDRAPTFCLEAVRVRLTDRKTDGKVSLPFFATQR